MAFVGDFELRDEGSYAKLDPSELELRVNDLRQKWLRYWRITGLESIGWGFSLDNFVLCDVVMRVDKRRAYYSYFHNMRISERKITGLYAYWIVKYHPVAVTYPRESDLTPEQKKYIASVNERFAAFLLYATVIETSPRKTVKPRAIEKMSKKSYYDALIYSLRFRNIPIDAMVLLAETMGIEDLERDISQK